MRPPSFEPWLSRIRLVRALSAGAGMIVLGGLSYVNGQAWDTAILHGFVAAIICYFVGWACSLWIASAMYAADYSKAKTELRAKHEERDRRMQEIVRRRLEALGAEFDDTAGTMTLNGETLEAPIPPPARNVTSIETTSLDPGLREAA